MLYNNRNKENGWNEAVLYRALKDVVALCFNLLNALLGGNLPPFGCVSVIVEQDGRFLIIQRPSGRLVFPGGFIRWCEYPEQAVVREGKEETGLTLRPLSLVGCYPAVSHHARRMSTLMLAYRAEVVAGELRESIEGRPLWLSKEEFAHKLSSIHQDIFRDYARDHDHDPNGVQPHTSPIS